MDRRAKPKNAKADGERARRRMPPKNDGAKVRDLEKRLAEAIGQLHMRDGELTETLKRKAEASKREAEAQEQQTATSEILRLISNSPTDVRPVFDALVKSAARFCAAEDAQILRLEGDGLRLVAHHGPIPAMVGSVISIGGTAAGRAVLERRAVHVADTQAETEQFPEGSAIARKMGWHTGLSVPLLREGVPLGVILLRRTEVAPFSEKQIALLQTFADQAVIAIENVRLFTELDARNHDLTEALEQQTATSEILRVISRSPTDVQPVFEAIARSAARLCNAIDANIQRLDGARLRVVAHHGPIPMLQTVLDEGWLLDAGSVTGRAILERRRIHVEDLASADEFPLGRDHARRLGYRTTLAVPLLRQGSAIGGIVVRREEIRPFTDSQMELLETFADQAVIAIENVRLFTELQASNRDLTTALDTQTATSEILRVIASSPTDLQPVFDTIAERSMRLCEAICGWVMTFDGELLHLRSIANVSPEGTDALRRIFPLAPNRATMAGRTIL